jgi:hypothetical protein
LEGTVDALSEQVYCEDGTVFAHMGTVSEGTERPEDTIPKFLDLLRTLAPPRATQVEQDWRAVIANPAHEDALECADALFEILSEFAPPGVYFGTLEGDGSDYGFWPDGGNFGPEQARARYLGGAFRASTVGTAHITVYDDVDGMLIVRATVNRLGKFGGGVGFGMSRTTADAIDMAVRHAGGW